MENLFLNKTLCLFHLLNKDSIGCFIKFM